MMLMIPFIVLNISTRGSKTSIAIETREKQQFIPKVQGTLAVTAGYFFSLKKIMRENLVSAIQRTVCVSTDQHVYVCRSLQINIVTYPLIQIISVVIFRSSEMKS